MARVSSGMLGPLACMMLLWLTLLRESEGLAMYLIEEKHCGTRMQEGVKMMGHSIKRGAARQVMVRHILITFSNPISLALTLDEHYILCRCLGKQLP